MIFATQTQTTAGRFGLVKGTEMLCQAGYPAIDFSISFVREESDLPSDADLFAMKETAARYGAFFNQAHAPFGYQLYRIIHSLSLDFRSESYYNDMMNNCERNRPASCGRARKG